MTNHNDTYSTVRFGDMAREVTESTHTPLEDGFERYIGLEHLDPESLKIRRWGLIEETETTFTRIFRAGQVLFGRRRAYQRKAALADFDGICSDDIIVMEAKPDRLLPELLPFIVQTEGFYEHALSTSAGSLSPRTKWSALAKYEFPPPPPDEQHRIAEILWAVEDAIEQYRRVFIALQQTLVAYQNEFFIRIPNHDALNWKELSLAEICDNTITYGIVQAGPHIDDGVPYIRVTDMTKGMLTAEGMLRTSKKIALEYERSRVETNDIIFALRGQLGLVLKVPSDLDGANLTQGTARISVDSKFDTDFVLWALRSPWVNRQLVGKAKGSTFKEISLGSLRQITVRLPDINTQMKIGELLNEIALNQQILQQHQEHILTLKQNLLESLIPTYV